MLVLAKRLEALWSLTHVQIGARNTRCLRWVERAIPRLAT